MVGPMGVIVKANAWLGKWRVDDTDWLEIASADGEIYYTGLLGITVFHHLMALMMIKGLVMRLFGTELFVVDGLVMKVFAPTLFAGDGPVMKIISLAGSGLVRWL